MGGTTTTGTLERYPLPRLLCFLAQKRFSGTLRVETQPSPKEVVVQGGIPVQLRPVRPDGLARLFLERGRLDNDTFSAVMQALSTPGTAETDVLQQTGGLNVDEIHRGQRYLLFSALCDLFQERSADFAITAGTEDGAADTAVAVEPMYLVYNGIRNVYDEDRLRAELTSVADRAIRLKPDSEATLARFGFSDEEAPLLRYLQQGYWLLEDLLSTVPSDPLPALMLVYALVAADLLEVVEANSVPRLRPKRAESPAPPPDAGVEPNAQASTSRASMPNGDEKAPTARGSSAEQKPTPVIRPTPRPVPRLDTPPSSDRIRRSNPTTAERARVTRKVIDTSTGQFAAARLPPLAVRKAKLAAQSIREAGELKPEAEEVLEELIRRLEAMDGQSPFALLDLPLDTTAVDVRKSYMQLVKRLHPDRLNALGLSAMGEAADTLFKRITEAHQSLADPENLDEARRIYQDAEAGHDPEAAARVVEAEVDFQKGEVFYRKGDLAQAEQYFEAAVEGNPEEGEHLAMLAWTRYQQQPRSGRKAAIGATREQLLRSLELNPRCARAHYFVGKLYLEEKNNDSALEAFRKASRLKRNYIEAMREMRLIEMRSRREGQTGRRSVLNMFTRKKK